MFAGSGMFEAPMRKMRLAMLAGLAAFSLAPQAGSDRGHGGSTRSHTRSAAWWRRRKSRLAMASASRARNRR